MCRNGDYNDDAVARWTWVIFLSSDGLYWKTAKQHLGHVDETHGTRSVRDGLRTDATQASLLTLCHMLPLPQTQTSSQEKGPPPHLDEG